MPRNKAQPQNPMLEEIHSITHYPGARIDILVGVGAMVPDLDKYNKVIGQRFEFAASQQFDCICVQAADYISMMSDTPAWNPDKKAGQFGQTDAWRAVGASRSGVALKDYRPE